MDNPDDAEYGLVMPFVSVASNGGDYDDSAYVAGYEAGHLAAEIDMCKAMPQGIPATPGPRTIHRGNVAQVDLLAMNAGYSVDVEDVGEDGEWAWVKFAAHEELP